MKRIMIPVLCVLCALALALMGVITLRTRSAAAAADAVQQAALSEAVENSNMLQAENSELRARTEDAEGALDAAQTELAALREENAALSAKTREQAAAAETAEAELAELRLREQILASRSITERSQKTAHVNDFQYLLYDPGVRTGEPLPLVLFLHGSGGCIDIYSDNTIPTMLSRGWLAPNALVLMPHCPGTDWEPYSADIMELLETVITEYGADRNRVSVTGFSLGGVGCFCMLVDYPDYFSAAMPFAAKCFPEKCTSITSTPVRIFHGEKDSNMDPSSVIKATEVINEAGGSCTLTFFPGEGHLIQQHYLDEGGALVDWLIAQRRTDK